MIIDGGGVVFDDLKHWYYYEGVRLPSVTTILKACGLATNFSTVPPDVLERARQRGVAVHSMCEAIDKGESIPSDLGQFDGYASAYRSFVADSSYRSIAVEVTLHHPRLRYAGRCDKVGWLNGVRALIDAKSSRTMDHKYTAVQCAAYRGAWNAMNPTEQIGRIAGLQLRPDGQYALTEYDAEEAWKIFLHGWELYLWKTR